MFPILQGNFPLYHDDLPSYVVLWAKNCVKPWHYLEEPVNQII